MRRKKAVKKAEKTRSAVHRSDDSKENIRKEKPEEKAPVFIKRNWPNPAVLEISKEAWEKPGARVGALSRIDWKTKGARSGLILDEFEICAERGCHYNVLNGGLVDKKYIETRIQDESQKLTSSQRRKYRAAIVDYVLQETANELNSILPYIKKPPINGDNHVEFVRLYIITSLILDGDYGEKIARILQQMRPDIRLYKQGGDRTRLKGVGINDEEKRRGQEIGWLNPKKHRIPGQFASTGVDADIREEEAAADTMLSFWIHGGLGANISKPGGGERKIARISLPVSHIPMPRRPGEPSVALNQIGVRTIETSPDGEERLIQTWNLRDLMVNERAFITGIKEGATDLQKKIVEVIKTDRKGFHVGELSDILEVPRETIEKEIQFLVEPKALKRTTYPGLYKDVESERYNFHLDWFQERLRYPWPYKKDYDELRRLLFGCLHAGYNTTDYEYVRKRFVEIILRFNIKVAELIGDITAGLKHHMMHKGQIIGNLNYTDQEILAAELLGTVFYDVFATRFKIFFEAQANKKPAIHELDSWIKEMLVLFLFIVGNHEAWQRENGHTPGVTFRDKLVALLNHHLGKFLQERGLFTPNLDEIVRSKILELSENKAIYQFSGRISAELLHPGMARTKTSSIRAEEALEYSNCHLVDVANFHTTFEMEKWNPELGERVATQVGAMTPLTYFEHGKLKRVDFGPTYVGTRAKNGRIFMVEHMFFPKPFLTEPLDRNTDIRMLKEKLNLLQAPK